MNYNITAITCKNAFDKTPFQVALMGKQRATAGFLLGKQWSRIQVSKSDISEGGIYRSHPPCRHHGINSWPFILELFSHLHRADNSFWSSNKM